MFNRLNSFVEKYNILTDAQHGFREGESMETACQSFIGSTLEALDNHLNAVGIFLHLSGAYDVLNHQILLEKLEIYRVRGVLKSWFKSYLSNHSLLKSPKKKMVTIILCIDTLPYVKKQLMDFPRVQ